MTDPKATLDPERIDESFVPRGDPSVGWIELEGESVLLAAGGDSHHLNPTGTVIWQCCDGSGPLGEIIDELSDAYGIDRRAIAPDVLELVRDLGRRGLLVGVRAGNGDGQGEGGTGDATESEPRPAPRYLEVPESG